MTLLIATTVYEYSGISQLRVGEKS
jgi:hypothetical protein